MKKRYVKKKRQQNRSDEIQERARKRGEQNERMLREIQNVMKGIKEGMSGAEIIQESRNAIIDETEDPQQGGSGNIL